MRARFTLPALLLLAACQQDPGVPDCDSAGAEGCARPSSEAPSSAAPLQTASPALDTSALNERKDPGKLLGYLGSAVNAGKWDEAARAWHTAEDGSPMTGAKLKALFGNPEKPLLSFGPGEQEGAAGSSFYTAPVLLIPSTGRGREGMLTLRRVNDVPGAEDWQLAWHVERLEWND